MQTIRTNLVNNASTQYTNHDFNSMILFNGIALGAGESGFHKICCGTDDNGVDIDAYFKTGSSLLNWPGKKKNRFIYLSVKTSGTIIVGEIGTITPLEIKSVILSVSACRMFSALKNGNDGSESIIVGILATVSFIMS